MTNHIPQPNEIYKHFKGNCYRVITLAEDSETGKILVIYQALYGENKVYARELSMFMSPVDHSKYPDVSAKMRFELLQNTIQPIAVEPVQPKAETHSVVEAQTENVTQIDSGLMKFLDADTYEDRIQILNMLKDSLTDEMINTMSVSIDVEIPEGPIQERYEALKYALSTRQRFECTRLR